MSTEIEIREEKQETFDIQKNNEYSIYDYLKNNPSILITLVSAIVAIVTFFAKSIMTVSIKNELAFWEFDYRYFVLGNESLFLNAAAFLFFSVLSCFCEIWFLETYELCLSYKKIELIFYYRIILYKKSIKEIKKKMPWIGIVNRKISRDNDYNKLYNDYRKAKFEKGKYFIKHTTPILVILIIIDSVYAIIRSINYSGISCIIIICLLAQSLTLFVLSKEHEKKIIDKKIIKKKCWDNEFMQEPKIIVDSKTCFLNLLFSRGLRHILNDRVIISIVVIFFVSFLTIFISYGFTNTDPTATNKFYRITTVDNIEYAIVYQNNNQYFLEEIEIKDGKMPDGKNQKTIIIIIYADCQRIIISDDMSAELYECKAEKGYKHRNKEQSFSTFI